MAPSARHFFPTTSLSLILITFLITLNLHPNPSEAARPHPANTKTPAPSYPNHAELFVRSACSSTSYPGLCISSLSSYSSSINSSPTLLAHTALSISLDGARSASATMKSMSPDAMSPREAGAMSDCMENVGDSIDELNESLSEMGNLRAGKDVGFQMNSIQAWVSAALTDDESCMGGFGGKSMDRSVKRAVRGCLVNVAHLTSNALALVNALASSTRQYSAASP